VLFESYIESGLLALVQERLRVKVKWLLVSSILWCPGSWKAESGY